MNFPASVENGFHYILNSLDPGMFITTINAHGQVSVLSDQEVILSDIQLPMSSVNYNAAQATYVDGEPCIVVAGYNEGAGVYLRQALTLCEVKSLPYKENVYCVCINATGIKVFFGTESGSIN